MLKYIVFFNKQLITLRSKSHCVSDAQKLFFKIKDYIKKMLAELN